MLVVGAGLWAATPTSDDDVATSPAETLAQVEPEVAAVLSAIDAYNAGDADGWVAAFDPAAEDVQAESWGYFFEILMNANDRLEIVEPCRLITDSPLVVECTIRSVNDFHGPAGISRTAPAQFLLNDDLQITRWDDNTEWTDERRFHDRFWTWLLITHPDILDQIRPNDFGSLPGWATDPADMSIAIQYVDEFVAQSDEYPLDPSDS